MTEWGCEDCGLIHQHSKTLHSLWDEIDWEYCKKLEFNQLYNCGAREAELRDYWDNPAPTHVPQGVEEEIREVVN